jgi:hypothetical protein
MALTTNGHQLMHIRLKARVIPKPVLMFMELMGINHANDLREDNLLL